MELKWKDKEAIQLLIDTGLLFRINTEILHPFGLALGAVVDKDTGIKEYGIFKSDDEDGMVFDNYRWTEGSEKYNWFLDNGGFEKFQKRLETLGFIVQEGPIDNVFRKLGKYDC